MLFCEFSAHLKDGSCSVQACLLHCNSNSCCCCRLAFNWRLRCKLLSCCSIRLSLLPEVWLSANLQQPVSLGQGHSDRELLAIDRSYSSCCAGGAEILKASFVAGMPCDSKTISGDDVIMLHSNCCARVLLLPGSDDCITARYAFAGD